MADRTEHGGARPTIIGVADGDLGQCRDDSFVIQLAGPGTYLPTERAERGGGYGAVVQSSLVGPEGGQVLVDRTVETINELWKTPAK